MTGTARLGKSEAKVSLGTLSRELKLVPRACPAPRRLVLSFNLAFSVQYG